MKLAETENQTKTSSRKIQHSPDKKHFSIFDCRRGGCCDEYKTDVTLITV